MFNPVAVFWDLENICPPRGSSGRFLADRIRSELQSFGYISVFNAYLDVNCFGNKSHQIHSELQSSGVSLIHCPHDGKKDVVDKTMIVDILAFAMDQPCPATIVLITGDGDFSYCASTLRLRNYMIVTATRISSTNRRLLAHSGVVLDLDRIFSSGSRDSIESVYKVGRDYAISIDDKTLPDCISASTMVSGQWDEPSLTSKITGKRSRSLVQHESLCDSTNSPEVRPLKRARRSKDSISETKIEIESKNWHCMKLSSKELPKDLPYSGEPFKLFVDIIRMQKPCRKGSGTSTFRLSWSKIADLLRRYPEAYHDAGIRTKRRRFQTYMAFAARAGVIELKGPKRDNLDPTEWWIEA